MNYRVTGYFGYHPNPDETRTFWEKFDLIVEVDTIKEVPSKVAKYFNAPLGNLKLTDIEEISTNLTFKESLIQKLGKRIQEDPVENTYKTVKEYLAEQGFEIETTRGLLYPSRWVLDVDYKLKVQVDLIYNTKDTFNLSVRANSKYFKPPYSANYVELTSTSVLGTIEHCLKEVTDAL